MWRLIPLLAVLGFLEVLVPWPDVAAFVLSSPRQSEVHLVSMRLAISPVEIRQERSPLLVQVRGTPR